ncbi:aldose epimerase family protein [Gillisia limnaea]|uniref:Aldose 1-epimerase n=1 Tax=Gillisia limnaea (strain DSM 15749 / LMG 21470 / R-8282) TaxID=865937 RepID=H2BRN5_GILLR|nr:aldose epimerase family protein [Gillisia limnaea]EHQ01350.1 aldose 1-epimerase [Gillisia limnaea DSM 15749]
MINKILTTFSGIFCIVLTVACKNENKQKNNIQYEDMKAQETIVLDPVKFNTTINGKDVKLYSITNNNGMEAYFTNFGGRLVGLLVPDKNGERIDVVIGMESTEAYQESTEPYFGATIGRYGNRIAKGKFNLEGKEYSVPTNNGENALHGGFLGFQNVVWNASQPNEHTLVLNYLSKDMEEGFPGNLKVQVTYSLTDENELKMEYEAVTDKTTVVNLTNHAFFNLNGEGSGSILDHSLKIYADKFTPVDDGLIPTGALKEVKGTPFDFLEPHTIGQRIEADNQQLENGKGYDHNFVLNSNKEKGMNRAATVVGNKSGIVMNVYTEEPGLQFYSGNFMEGKNRLKTGATDDFRTAFALETQHFPDSPNQPEFPSTILEPGEIYKSTSIYEFSVK